MCIPVVAALILSFTLPASAQIVTSESAWRTLAGKLGGGAVIDLRLRDGAHFKATFIAAEPDGVLLQRKTRIPVEVEQVDYDAIVSMSLVQPSSMTGARIAGIALGSAGAAIGAFFLILLATLD